ncbi:MAG: hypothetical protein E7159_03485 [Firmicutes bacterium]|nr:hypothetical protein [Bacillota bacterium]
MEEKLKTISDNINSYISDEMAKVEKANNIKKELDSELERLKDYSKQVYQKRDQVIEEANKKAEEEIVEETNRVFLKYEDILKEFRGGIVQKEQPLENFDIPNMEINTEEKQEISQDLENELFNQTKEDNYTDIVSNDVVIENNDENKEEEQPEFTQVSDPQVSVNFENGTSEVSSTFDVNTEEDNQIQTGEPIQVIDVEPYEKKEETKENTEVKDEVVNAAPGTDVFVGSLPAEFAQVDNSQQEAVQETASVEDVAQEQPISNFELSSGFTDIVDSMEQGRARGLHPAN